jgi:SCY1-like protein 1
MAGVIALSATQQYFSLAEVAQKVLPSLAPLTVDPEKQVKLGGINSKHFK